MAPKATELLRLERFLPYRLSVLTNRISGAIARLYAERFDLGIPEWRVMAVLGRHPGISAREVMARTAMDKVTVSRAAARLAGAGRLTRAVHGADRRRSVLRLSRAGIAVYREIAPLALSKERTLLAALAPADRKALDRLLDMLGEAADRL